MSTRPPTPCLRSKRPWSERSRSARQRVRIAAISVRTRAASRGSDRSAARTREKRAPSIAAAVLRDGELIWESAVGVADVEADVQATPGTQYRVGSITKTFTATEKI